LFFFAHNGFSFVVDSGNNSGLKPYSFIKFSSTVLKCNSETNTPLALWYEQNQDDVLEFEKQMRRKVHYVIKPEYLWRSVAELARKQHNVFRLNIHKHHPTHHYR
jgi:hypothetical protein